jgi:aminoglycoside phosphotransferase (APT) family kinase protein
MSQTLVDEVALAEYLARQLPGPMGPITVTKVGHGHSNLTYLIRRSSDNTVPQSLILRRPPPGPLLPTTHDMVREYAFLTALADSPLPVPRPLLLCEDASVLGATFYLMEYLPGITITDTVPPYLDNPGGRASLAEATIQTLALMHSVDYKAVGLDKVGKPEGYLERQVRRRAEQLAMTVPHTRPLPLMEKIGEWLRQHLPPSPAPAIVHGDFRIDNMIFAPEAPARPLAVLDWETATIGDPLVDLGYLLSFWVEPGGAPLPVGLRAGSITGLEGFPGRREMAERYAALTGRDLEYLNYYQVFSVWKLAISLEGGYARHLATKSDDPFYAAMEKNIPEMAEWAWELCQQT